MGSEPCRIDPFASFANHTLSHALGLRLYLSISNSNSSCVLGLAERAKKTAMASLALSCPPLKPLFCSGKKTQKLRRSTVVCSVQLVIGNAETKERYALKQLFHEAYERCRLQPYEGVPFTTEDVANNIDGDTFTPQIGSMVTGTVTYIDSMGASVDINSKGPAFLPIEEASIHDIDSIEEAGIVLGLTEEFEVIDVSDEDDSLILSLKKIQYNYAWERCRQLQAEDVTVKGLILSANKGGLAVLVESLRGFIPFSQLSSNAMAEELIGMEIPLKFVEIDEEEARIILSNRKAMADSQAQLGIGSVVTGTVQSLKPYGAFIDIGGINGLLHVSQISHDRVSDIETVLQPGDTLKVMILSHDRERGRVSLSTKKLEPTPGDMIRNPTLVFEKAEEMAQTFRQRIALAESMARADMLRFQPESGLTLSSDGILGSLASDFPEDGLNFTDDQED